MGRLAWVLLLVLMAAGPVRAWSSSGDRAFPKLSGPYLGQEPPGMEPELFAPDILPADGVEHCFPAFSPDGRQVYWLRVDVTGERPRGEIWRMREIDGLWHPPELAPFSGRYNDHSPVFASDGNRLYFASDRPGGVEDCRSIWYVERADSGWSDPIYMGSPPNTEVCATQPAFTDDGTVYFVGRYPDAQWGVGIYRSRVLDGEYQTPEPLGSNINKEGADLYPFIAPDESYLLFGSNRPGAVSSETDLFVSLRTEEGNFGEPVHLGEEINNGLTVSFSCVTHDGKYLFFSRFDRDDENGTDLFYWVDAAILDPHLPGARRRQMNSPRQ